MSDPVLWEKCQHHMSSDEFAQRMVDVDEVKVDHIHPKYLDRKPEQTVYTQRGCYRVLHLIRIYIATHPAVFRHFNR